MRKITIPQFNCTYFFLLTIKYFFDTEEVPKTVLYTTMRFTHSAKNSNLDALKQDLVKAVANVLSVPRAYVTMSQTKEVKILQTRSEDFTMMAKIAYKNEKDFEKLKNVIDSGEFLTDFNKEVKRIASLNDKGVILANITTIGNEYMLNLSSVYYFLLEIF